MSARVVSTFSADSFNLDEYYIMLDVKRGFRDYLAHYRGNDGRHVLFSLPLLVHYWVSAHAVGTSLGAFRAASLAASSTLLVLTALSLRRLWPTDRLLPAGTLAVLAFQAHLLWLARYAMFAYSNTVLVSAGLFFLFLRLADGPLSRRAWLMISLALVPAAFFTQMIMVVALAVGVLLVLTFRWARAPGLWRVPHLLSSLRELAPLLLVPVTYALTWLVAPYDMAGARRADNE